MAMPLRRCGNPYGLSASDRQPDVAKWRARTRDDVSWLVSSINSDNKHTRWLIDTEFCNPPGNISPIIMEIAIRDLGTGQLLLSSTVDYDGITKEDMMEKLGLNQAAQMRRVVFTSCFNKIYPKGYTEGSSIEGLRDKILQLGYSPQTHNVISYGPVLDPQIFLRVWFDVPKVNAPRRTVPRSAGL